MSKKKKKKKKKRKNGYLTTREKDKGQLGMPLGVAHHGQAHDLLGVHHAPLVMVEQGNEITIVPGGLRSKPILLLNTVPNLDSVICLFTLGNAHVRITFA